ncbi:hypothetical protein J6590_000990 [Homalodisca vitripennis]|nr:hypothetical protein J6590_000990 [Homalodisca vitripennis]
MENISTSSEHKASTGPCRIDGLTSTYSSVWWFQANRSRFRKSIERVPKNREPKRKLCVVVYSVFGQKLVRAELQGECLISSSLVLEIHALIAQTDRGVKRLTNPSTRQLVEAELQGECLTSSSLVLMFIIHNSKARGRNGVSTHNVVMVEMVYSMRMLTSAPIHLRSVEDEERIELLRPPPLLGLFRRTWVPDSRCNREGSLSYISLRHNLQTATRLVGPVLLLSCYDLICPTLPLVEFLCRLLFFLFLLANMTPDFRSQVCDQTRYKYLRGKFRIVRFNSLASFMPRKRELRRWTGASVLDLEAVTLSRDGWPADSSTVTGRTRNVGREPSGAEPALIWHRYRAMDWVINKARLGLQLQL